MIDSIDCGLVIRLLGRSFFGNVSFPLSFQDVLTMIGCSSIIKENHTTQYLLGLLKVSCMAQEVLEL